MPTPSVYLALLIPIIVTGIFYYFKRHEYTWWEFFIPIIVVAIAIFSTKALTDYTAVQFTEYWGSTITSVVEEEPYNYWHSETCSYTTTDSTGNSTTHYYDCSHQDDVGPHWYGKTNIGETVKLTEKQYDETAKMFGTKRFVINSRSNYDSDDRCVGSQGTKFEGKKVGKTSYVYATAWNGTDETRKPYSSMHSYTNKIKSSDLSVFNIKLVNEVQADSLGLFKYPEIKSGMFTSDGGLDFPTILGRRVPVDIQKKFMRLNGKYGPSKELRLWVLVFDDKPEKIAEYQENYWVKGNMNELVLCIGRKGQRIMWTHAFSWGKSNTLTASVEQMARSLYTYRDSVYYKKAEVIPTTVAMRKAMKLKHLPIIPVKTGDSIMKVRVKSEYPILNDQTWNQLYVGLNKNLIKFERRSFKEFDYLTVEPKAWVLWLIYILALFFSIGVNFWCVNNEIYDNSGEESRGSYNDYNSWRR